MDPSKFSSQKTKTLREDLHHLVTLRKKLRRFGGDKMHETFAGLYDEQMLFYDEKHGVFMR